MKKQPKRGRPALPEERRAASYSFSMRPKVVEALRAMSATQGRPQAAILEDGIRLVRQDQARKLAAGRRAFERYLRAEVGLFAVDGATFQIAIRGKAHRVHLTDKAAFGLGVSPKRAATRLADANVAAAVRSNAYISVDVNDSGELICK